MNFLLVLLICIASAYFLSELCKYFKIPRVVGQVSAGIILGLPLIKKYLFSSENLTMLSFFSDIGIVLLFFFVGLEINFKDFKKNFKESVWISILNTLIPFFLGLLFCRLIGMDYIAGIIVGICLAVSAQSVSIDFLEEFKMLKTRIGKLIIMVGAIDDIIELIFISIIFALIHISVGKGNLYSLFLGAALFIAFILAFKGFIIPLIMKLFCKDNNKASLFTGALIITLLMATLSEYLGFGAVIGALLAGVLVRQFLLTGKNRKPWEEHEIADIIHIISFGFLIPIFFVFVGLNTDLSSAFSNLSLSLAFTLIAIFGTIAGTVIGVLLSRGTFYEGFLLGIGVNPKGDVELVMATLALQKGLITVDIFSALIVMVLLTTIISPILFRYVLKSYSRRYNKFYA
jgi:Kef-type K+ transport system membrane component KefB